MRLPPAEALDRNRQFLINSGTVQWLSGRNQFTRRTTGGFLQHSARPGKTPGSPRPKLPRSSIGLNRSCRSASPENDGSIPSTSASSRASIESLFLTSWRKIRSRRAAVARAHESSRSPLLKAANHDLRPVRRSTMAVVFRTTRSLSHWMAPGSISLRTAVTLLRNRRTSWIVRGVPRSSGALSRPGKEGPFTIREGSLWSTYVREGSPRSKLVSQAAALSWFGLLAQGEGWRARPRRAPSVRRRSPFAIGLPWSRSQDFRPAHSSRTASSPFHPAGYSTPARR